MSETDSERPFAALPQPEAAEPASPRVRNLEIPEAVGIFFLLLIAAACGGLIAVFWPWSGAETAANSDRLSALEMRVEQLSANRPATSTDERKSLDALRQRLDADEARLNALENSGASASDPQALAKLNQRVAALEAIAPPADLKQQLSSFTLKSDEAMLNARLLKLESRDPLPALKRAAAMMALGDVQRVSASGAPFVSELATLRTAAPDLPEVNALARYAHDGVPTRPALAARMSRDASAFIATAREARAKTWLQRLWLHVTDLVSVRRVGATSGKTTQDILARAEIDANRNDLEAAVKEMSALDAPARAAAKGWIDAANARIALDRALRSLSDRVVAMLAAPIPAPPQEAPQP